MFQMMLRIGEDDYHWSSTRNDYVTQMKSNECLAQNTDLVSSNGKAAENDDLDILAYHWATIYSCNEASIRRLAEW